MSKLHEDMKHLDDKIYGCGQGADYMSGMDNWLCVHATKYKPKRNPKGELYVETTGMATGYRLPRGTVHVTLNQIVGSHMGGNWDAVPIVLLVPYNDLVRKNSNPQEIAVEDTYFAPNPATGLVLPDSAYIIEPDPDNKELYKIGEHGATYKTDEYTDGEVEDILNNCCSVAEREKYEEYLKGNVKDYEVVRILGYDERWIKLYNSAKDKKAFMRGIFEEKRFEMLSHFLRDAVVKMSMEKMGYHYVHAHEDNVSQKVAEVARAAGIEGNSGNKGHSNSVECELEMYGCALNDLVEVLKSKNMVEIFDYLTSFKRPLNSEIIDNITEDTPLPNIHKTFEKVYDDYVERFKDRYEMNKDSEWFSDETKEMWQKRIKDMDRGLKEYNQFLNATLSYHSRRVTLECEKALKELRQDKKGYDKLKENLIKYREQEYTGETSKETFMDGETGSKRENGDFLGIFTKNSKDEKIDR